MGVFFKGVNREGAIAGMVAGLVVTLAYIIWFKSPWFVGLNGPDRWLFGISPEGFGVVGMAINFAVAVLVARFTAPTPNAVRSMVDEIRLPRGAGAAPDAH